LGKEVFDQLIEPLMGGIYSGDASQLSLAATFPQLRQLELKHGSLIKGLLAKQNASPQATATPASTYPPFVTFRSGMSTLVELLLQRLTNSTLITGCAVERITPRNATRSNDFSRSGTRGTTEVVTTGGRSFEADALILTTPAFVTAALVAPWDAELAAAHEAIPYASTAIVTLAYADSKLPAPLDGRGYVIPSIEATDVKACTWTSSKWAGRAPDGFALIRVYLGRYGSRNILENSDQQLLQLAQNELKR
ncbi:MAG: protoporphyrinogen oxidase, partial [Ardenticatenaceae bacterium]